MACACCASRGRRRGSRRSRYRARARWRTCATASSDSRCGGRRADVRILLGYMPAAELLRVRFRRLWEEARAHPELIWLAVIVAIGGAARFATLGLQSFDSGETVTAARIIHPSYAATFNAYSTIERSGPLYYTLAWGWAHAFGTGEVALRSLSAIFGTATIALVFAAAREAFSTRAALIAAALVAASP